MLAVVALPTVVLGRGEGSRSGRAVLAAGAIVAGWSAWALATAPVDVWAATLALPLTAGPAWTLALWAIVYALPWSPLAALIGFRTVRDGLGDEGRRVVLGWLKVAGALAIAGTIVPGLGDAGRLPLLFGLAIAAAAGLDRLIGGVDLLDRRPPDLLGPGDRRHDRLGGHLDAPLRLRRRGDRRLSTGGGPAGRARPARRRSSPDSASGGIGRPSGSWRWSSSPSP